MLNSERRLTRLIVNQRLLASARPFLDLRFTLECFRLRDMPLAISQANRSAAASVLCPFARIVLFRPIEHVGGNPRVKRIVVTAQQIHEVREAVSCLSGVVHRRAANGNWVYGAIVRIPKFILRNHSFLDGRHLKILGIRNPDPTAII